VSVVSHAAGVWPDHFSIFWENPNLVFTFTSPLRILLPSKLLFAGLDPPYSFPIACSLLGHGTLIKYVDKDTRWKYLAFHVVCYEYFTFMRNLVIFWRGIPPLKRSFLGIIFHWLSLDRAVPTDLDVYYEYR